MFHVSPSRRTAHLAAAALAVTLVLSGCAAGGPGGGGSAGAGSGGTATLDPDTPEPVPSATETPVPAVNRGQDDGVDPRCARQFPDKAEVIHEAELDGRPGSWPTVPEWAALCWAERENATTVVAWYATDPGISRAEIYRHYEQGLAGVGASGRVDAEEGEILTGGVLPEHSFWMLAERDQYSVTWAVDGDYGE